jgi:hypothetical protein
MHAKLRNGASEVRRNRRTQMKQRAEQKVVIETDMDCLEQVAMATQLTGVLAHYCVSSLPCRLTTVSAHTVSAHSCATPNHGSGLASRWQVLA